MSGGEIATVIFGLVVFGMMFRTLFPKTYKKLNDCAARLGDK